MKSTIDNYSRYLFPILIFVIGVFADQITKFLARLAMANPVTVNDWLSFRLTYNTGASFGMLQGSNSILTVISIAVFCIIVVNWNKVVPAYFIPGGLAMAGILGNVIDRIWLGKVTDFISIGWWPVFNLADAFITIAVLIALYLNLVKKIEPVEGL